MPGFTHPLPIRSGADAERARRDQHAGLAKCIKAKIFQASTSGSRRSARSSAAGNSHWGHVKPLGCGACYDEGSAPPKPCSSTIIASTVVRIKVARISSKGILARASERRPRGVEFHH